MPRRPTPRPAPQPAPSALPDIPADEAARICGLSPAIALNWRKEYGVEAFDAAVQDVARILRAPFAAVRRRLEQNS